MKKQEPLENRILKTITKFAYLAFVFSILTYEKEIRTVYIAISIISAAWIAFFSTVNEGKWIYKVR